MVILLHRQSLLPTPVRSPMSTPASPLSPPTGVELVDLSDRAARLARDLAPTIERERRLPEARVDELRATGLMRACVPAELGGSEPSPGTVLNSAERIARGDASTGWCVSIAATSSLLAAYLPAAGAGEIFGDQRTVAAGVWAPRGKALVVEGGIRVSGRWAFCRPPSSRSLIPGARAASAEPEVTTPRRTICSCPTTTFSRSRTDHASRRRSTVSRSSGSSRCRSLRRRWVTRGAR